jgi:hypothetical protein
MQLALIAMFNGHEQVSPGERRYCRAGSTKPLLYPNHVASTHIVLERGSSHTCKNLIKFSMHAWRATVQIACLLFVSKMCCRTKRPFESKYVIVNFSVLTSFRYLFLCPEFAFKYPLRRKRGGRIIGKASSPYPPEIFIRTLKWAPCKQLALSRWKNYFGVIPTSQESSLCNTSWFQSRYFRVNRFRVLLRLSYRNGEVRIF